MSKNHEPLRIPLRYALPGILLFGAVLDKNMTDGYVADKMATVIDGMAEGNNSILGASVEVEYTDQRDYEDIGISEVGHKMLSDITPYKTLDADWVYEQMSRQEDHREIFGEEISMEDMMRYFYIAGFRGRDLQIITAISRRESSGFPGAVGDWNFNDRGSVSVGLTQIRCITEGNKLPCEGPRDWRSNLDPLQSARNTYALHLQSIEYYGFGNDEMGYDGRFHPWVWHKALQDAYGDDPAENEFLPQSQAVYKQLEALYGDISK